jgi:hypothetical protein
MAMTFALTIDCADPAALSKFWADMLGYEPEGPPEGSASWEEWFEKMEVPEEEWAAGASIADPEDRGARIFFQQVPEPKTAKNRLHLDLDASDGTRSRPTSVRNRSRPRSTEQPDSASLARPRTSRGITTTW